MGKLSEGDGPHGQNFDKTSFNSNDVSGMLNSNNNNLQESNMSGGMVNHMQGSGLRKIERNNSSDIDMNSNNSAGN